MENTAKLYIERLPAKPGAEVSALEAKAEFSKNVRQASASFPNSESSPPVGLYGLLLPIRPTD